MKNAIARLGIAGIAATIAMGFIVSATMDILDIQDPSARMAFMTIAAIVTVPFVLWLTARKETS